METTGTPVSPGRARLLAFLGISLIFIDKLSFVTIRKLCLGKDFFIGNSDNSLGIGACITECYGLNYSSPDSFTETLNSKATIIGATLLAAN